MNELTLITPEKVTLTYRLATVESRISAHIVDGLVFFVLGLCISVISAQLGSIGVAFVLVYWSLGYFLVMAIQEYFWNGQTLGKFVTGLRVVMADGTPITFPAALYRNLLRVADFLPTLFFTGLVCITVTAKNQRLGDIVANTVVLTKKYPQRVITSPHTVQTHPLERELPSLRRMNHSEYRLIKQLADRAPHMPPEVLEAKIAQIWPSMQERHNIPSPQGVHPIYMIEATVMKYGRERNLL